MKIPPVAVSRLDFAVPQDGPEVEVPTAYGAVVREGVPPRVTAQLGPADRLTIRCQEGGSRSPTALPPEAGTTPLAENPARVRGARSAAEGQVG